MSKRAQGAKETAFLWLRSAGVWGLIVANPRKSYFWKSHSIHVLATVGGKGVGVGVWGLIVEDPRKTIHVLAMGRGMGLNNGKPKVKIFLGKLFHPYVGYNKWWQGGGGRCGV